MDNAPRIKEVLIFSMPQVLIMLCHLCVNLTDTWVAGRLGDNVQAALGIVTQINIFIFLIISFSGTGFNSSIAQSLGGAKKKRAEYYVFSMLVICFALSFLVAIFSILLLVYTPLLNHQNEKVFDVVKVFFIANCLNLPFFYLMIMINGVFRAYKYTGLPCKTVALVCTVNFIGTLGFGLGYFGFPNYSYYGVAYSTLFAGILGFLYNFYVLFSAKIISKKSIPSLAWCKKALPYVFKIGVPSAFASLVMQSGSVIVMFIVLAFPYDTTAVIAGMTLGAKVSNVVVFLISALAISVGILIGHLMGAKNYEAIFNMGKKIIALSFVFSSVLSLFLFVFRVPIVHSMSLDENVITQAFYYLYFACVMLPFMGANTVISGIFGGTGANKLSLIINIISTWCFNIPFAYFLSLKYGISAIYMVSVLSAILCFILLLKAFYSRKWQEYGLIK